MFHKRLRILGGRQKDHAPLPPPFVYLLSIILRRDGRAPSCNGHILVKFL